MDYFVELRNTRNMVMVVASSLMDEVAQPDIDADSVDGSLDILIMLLDRLNKIVDDGDHKREKKELDPAVVAALLKAGAA